MIKKTFLVAVVLAFGITSFAQKAPETANWYNKGKAGMDTEKAYKKLKKKKSETVIVAVIDSGVDIEHEDLQGKIWTNSKEIPGNGIDDDKNGYIDDIHGWNFLGNASGENVNAANLEKTRIFRTLGERFADADANSIAQDDRADFDLYQKLKGEIQQEKAMYEQYLGYMDMMPMIIKQVPMSVGEKIGKADYTAKDLEKWKPTSPEEIQLKATAEAILSGDLSLESIEEQKKQLTDMIDFNLNVDFNERKTIGDNPDDFSDKKYGNNDVEGPDALHGTHVSGIIGAGRHNKIGYDGVAENVLIMSLRAVPNGDEADKDIALAIRYAVDNGAKVINMSFGKSYSPHQKEVAEAFQYAASKDVLLVHAAGNDGSNLDVANNFPTNQYSFQSTPTNLFLTIGASTKDAKKLLAADFSNYSQTKVDIFAPGHEIWNTVPQSQYKKLQGTSMAAPMVSGVAAMLKSYFPTLTMDEIRTVILTSGKSYKGEQEIQPGSENMVDFGTLSVTGSVVNVKNAVAACKVLEKSKKK
ncbi:MAG: S8 family peptidase [Crocinitomicaceae bacterium]